MHTLEAEYLELKAAGVVDEPTATRATALDRGSIFSLYSELRFALYAAVAAITAGIGLMLKHNLDRIEPATMIVVLILIALLCYASAERIRRRGVERSIGGDYVLLLGALILSAAVGYAEFRFHWLGANWSLHLLLLAAVHAATAYYFNSRLVLSVALTSLAGWFGIQPHIDTLFAAENTWHQYGIHALLCAGTIMAWREVHLRTSRPQPFVEVLEHFAANLAFWGALAWVFDSSTRWIGILMVIGFAVASIRNGLRNRQEAFVAYGIAYATVGLCVIEATTLKRHLVIVLLALITIVTAATLLWRFHSQLKAMAK